MCGIVGAIGIKPENADRIIRNMVKSIAHRGPDADGIWVKDNTSLGHTRLSIIDLSEEANQPMVDDSGRYVMVYNGEIYNFLKIKEELKGENFRTNSDTEVLLKAYIRWGKKCLNKLNGMFAIAIWDNVTQELFIARDRLGIKPFYYYWQGRHFIFASELRALLSSGVVPRKISTTGLYEYLSYETVHAPNTIINNVFQLLPGECGLFDGNEMIKERWWKLSDAESIEESPEQIRKTVLSKLQKSIERRMISDVPLGAFLSGGIDSSAIVALMAEGSSQAINTFSVGFTEKKYDESPHATIVAKKFNTKHQQVILSPNDLLKNLPAILHDMDSPSSDGPNTWMVSKATKKAGLTVALSGLGGDELFAGYEVYKQIHRLNQNQYIWKIPKPIRKLGGTLAFKANPTRRLGKFKAILQANSPNPKMIYPVFRELFNNDFIRKLSPNLPFNKKSGPASLVGINGTFDNLSLMSQVSYCEISTYTQNVLLRDTDQMSMAHALEVRVPFFDHELVNYVLGIKDDIKYPATPKKLLVEALGDRLPLPIVNRKKMGFTLPWEFWLKNELFEFCAKRIKGLADRPYFNSIELEKLWNGFITGSDDIVWNQIWVMVVLEEWLTFNNVE